MSNDLPAPLLLVLECSAHAQMKHAIEDFLDEQGLPETMGNSLFAASLAEVIERDYSVPARAVMSIKQQYAPITPPRALTSQFRELARHELKRNDFLGHLSGHFVEFFNREVSVVPGEERVRLIVK